jgi:3-oxoacyl-[acyl-carrier-protein] synthase-3
VKYAAIGPIAVHFPDRLETNDDLQREFPAWNMELIGEKTGVMQRYVAAPDECASDLGVKAGEALFANHGVDPASIDYLMFCTQTPDYALPTTACVMQDRLGLGTHVGAFDFNLGCSGYVYGLAMADGLIRAELAKNILLITAETYTKMIDPGDRSLRTIFGDAGCATLIRAEDRQSLKGFKFGTDGKGANTLIANAGGFRSKETAIPPRGKKRWRSDLYMDGPALIDFSLDSIPGLVRDVCEASGYSLDTVHNLLFHQATRKMLEELQRVLEVDESKLPIRIEDVGNTVSCTLPILIDQMRRDGSLKPEAINMLVGFGVGWSWGGCIWQDILG